MQISIKQIGVVKRLMMLAIIIIFYSNLLDTFFVYEQYTNNSMITYAIANLDILLYV